MTYRRTASLGLCALALVVSASADVIVNYSLDGGGTNVDPLNGLTAQATFATSGNQLSVLLENTSTGVPASFTSADSLLVSLGFNLPAGIAIASGDAAVIGPGSVGVGDWAGRVAGDSVAEEWIWTNDFGGDLMDVYAQVISTSNGQGGGTVTGFGGNTNVSGPFGGIGASPLLRPINQNQPAVSDSIRFDLTLTGALTADQLQAVADASIVEYGSDARYLLVPEPAAGLVLLAAAVLRRRR